MRALLSNLISGAYRMDCYQKFDLAAIGWLKVRPAALFAACTATYNSRLTAAIVLPEGAGTGPGKHPGTG